MTRTLVAAVLLIRTSLRSTSCATGISSAWCDFRSDRREAPRCATFFPNPDGLTQTARYARRRPSARQTDVLLPKALWVLIRRQSFGVRLSQRIEALPKKGLASLTCGIRQQESRKRLEELSLPKTFARKLRRFSPDFPMRRSMSTSGGRGAYGDRGNSGCRAIWSQSGQHSLSGRSLDRVRANQELR